VPFGEVFLEEKNAVWNTPYLFNGKELDKETGMSYYGARYYEPKTSVWISVDPLAEKFAGRSPYEYCFSNPVNLVDPDGMAPTDDYGIDKSGKIELLNKTDDKTDTLYTASRDRDGKLKKDENADSITVEKDVLDKIENTEFIINSKTGKKCDIQLFDASKSSNPNKLFEFVSNNSINEFSLSKFENGTSIIGTSFKESSEYTINIIMPRYNSKLTSYEHSHPMDFDGINPSPADLKTAGIFKTQEFNPNLRIYAPLIKQYKKYDENSVSVELKEVIISSKKAKNNK
jgi:RHS repeat-associated protein